MKDMKKNIKLAVNKMILNNIFDDLGLTYKVIKNIKINGIKLLYNEGRYYFVKDVNKLENLIVVECDNDNIYKLDCFQSPIDYRKIPINQYIDEDTNNEDVYIYIEVIKNTESKKFSIEKYKKDFCEKRQFQHCDLNLLIPAKLEKGKDIAIFNEKIHEISKIRKQEFEEEIVVNEFRSKFPRDINRVLLGEVIITDKNREFSQRALLELAYHNPTKFCICEIYIPNVSIGANKILAYYTSNNLKIDYNGKSYSNITEFLNDLSLKEYGRKRSMIFSNDSIEDQELINALANEEFPIGKIGGNYFGIDKIENIAAYDTARVYVSTSTMVELCKNFEEFYDVRAKYEMLETFFVELILYEDAAMDKIYKDLQEEESKQRKNIDYDSSEKIDEINFDMSKAIQFADFEQFNFPTVRISSNEIAKKFGISYVFDKYEENKELLKQMVESNKKTILNNENKVKNKFLFIIASLEVFKLIYEIINSIISGNINIVVCVISLLVIIYIVYLWLTEKSKKNGKSYES